MEKGIKWEKSSEIELPKHSSRARPLTERELLLRKQTRARQEDLPKDDPKETLAQGIARYHVEKERREGERRGKGKVGQSEDITTLEEEKVALEKERALTLTQLEEFYTNFDNDKDPEKVQIKEQREKRLEEIEKKLEVINKNIDEEKVKKFAGAEGENVVGSGEKIIEQPPAVAAEGAGNKQEGKKEPTPIPEKKLGKREKIEEQELNDARKEFALGYPKEKNTRGFKEYEQKQRDYEIRRDAYRDFIIEHKKLTLEKKGLTPEQVNLELDKYIEKVIAPHFAVVEAAKIQEARTEPSFIEKMKGSKLGNLAATVIDGYRKMPWQKKLLVSAGLFGAGVTVGAVGGAGLAAVGVIITGGKGIQRILSGAGTAVGIDALIQRSQQKWMSKNGWGKDRHEYISKQISLTREKIKGGDRRGQDIEKLLDERAKMEKRNEMKRTGLAAIAGVLVGSGTAFRVADEYLGISDKIRTADEYLGISDKVSTAGNYWGDKLSHLFEGSGEAPTKVPTIPHHEVMPPKIEEAPKVLTSTPPIEETIAPEKIESIKLTIGTRGPEGAIIDEFRRDPEIAKKFGWQGGSKEELSKWAGTKARILWENSAKQALLDPTVKQELAKFGYPETTEGYEKAMTRIGKGMVSLDVDKGSIKLDVAYLKNTISSPSVLSSVDIPQEELAQPSGTTVNYMVGGVPQTPIHETILSQHGEGVEPSAQPIDFVEIQKQMDLPEGKLRGILINSGVRSPAIEDLLKREGGVEKLLKMQVRELHGIEEGYTRDARLDRLYEGLQRITGDARLEGNDTLEDVLKSIDSKEIFHGTAEEILKDEIPAPQGTEPAPSDIAEGITNPEESPALADQEETTDEPQTDEEVEETKEVAEDETPASSVAPSEASHEETPSAEEKTSNVVKEAGQISSNEVATKTGIKGVFDYDASGKITDMRISGSDSILKGRTLLYDNYEEIMRKKGAKIMDVRLVDLSAQKLFYQEQLLKTLEDSGQGRSDKAEFLKKAIKDATRELESRFGNIFK